MENIVLCKRKNGKLELEEISDLISQLNPFTPVSLISIISEQNECRIDYTNQVTRYLREICNHTVNPCKTPDISTRLQYVSDGLDCSKIILWPEAFYLNKNRTFVVLVLLVEFSLADPISTKTDTLEVFLALASSHVIEINGKCSNFRLQRIHTTLMNYDEEFSNKKGCRSAVYLKVKDSIVEDEYTHPNYKHSAANVPTTFYTATPDSIDAAMDELQIEPKIFYKKTQSGELLAGDTIEFFTECIRYCNNVPQEVEGDIKLPLNQNNTYSSLFNNCQEEQQITDSVRTEGNCQSAKLHFHENSPFLRSQSLKDDIKNSNVFELSLDRMKVSPILRKTVNQKAGPSRAISILDAKSDSKQRIIGILQRPPGVAAENTTKLNEFENIMANTGDIGMVTVNIVEGSNRGVFDNPSIPSRDSVFKDTGEIASVATLALDTNLSVDSHRATDLGDNMSADTMRLLEILKNDSKNVLKKKICAYDSNSYYFEPMDLFSTSFSDACSSHIEFVQTLNQDEQNFLKENVISHLTYSNDDLWGIKTILDAFISRNINAPDTNAIRLIVNYYVLKKKVSKGENLKYESSRKILMTICGNLLTNYLNESRSTDVFLLSVEQIQQFLSEELKRNITLGPFSKMQFRDIEDLLLKRCIVALLDILSFFYEIDLSKKEKILITYIKKIMHALFANFERENMEFLRKQQYVLAKILMDVKTAYNEVINNEISLGRSAEKLKFVHKESLKSAVQQLKAKIRNEMRPNEPLSPHQLTLIALIDNDWCLSKSSDLALM